MNLEKLLNPRSIAVVGASEKPGFGLSTCTNLLKSPKTDHIYFIHPHHESVLGKSATAALKNCRSRWISV